MLRTHTHTTAPTQARAIVRRYVLIDAKDQVLGKVATRAARILQGKHKRTYVDHLESGDHVVIVNAQSVVVTGRKGVQKSYTRYSGYPGGLRKATFTEAQTKSSSEVVRHAISGMLPKNKLRDRRLARLHIYPQDTHPYGAHITTS